MGRKHLLAQMLTSFLNLLSKRMDCIDSGVNRFVASLPIYMGGDYPHTKIQIVSTTGTPHNQSAPTNLLRYILFRQRRQMVRLQIPGPHFANPQTAGLMERAKQDPCSTSPPHLHNPLFILIPLHPIRQINLTPFSRLNNPPESLQHILIILHRNRHLGDITQTPPHILRRRTPIVTNTHILNLNP